MYSEIAKDNPKRVNKNWRLKGLNHGLIISKYIVLPDEALGYWTKWRWILDSSSDGHLLRPLFIWVTVVAGFKHSRLTIQNGVFFALSHQTMRRNICISFKGLRYLTLFTKSQEKKEIRKGSPMLQSFFLRSFKLYVADSYNVFEREFFYIICSERLTIDINRYIKNFLFHVLFVKKYRLIIFLYNCFCTRFVISNFFTTTKFSVILPE